MSVCCECCVLSGRGLCDGLITHPEESYGLWWVVVCDLETSRMRRLWPTAVFCSQKYIQCPRKSFMHYALELTCLSTDCVLSAGGVCDVICHVV